MPEHELGRYTGELILRPLKDGRWMETVLDFGFLEADGLHWTVPPGATVDGASIPRPLWSIMGGPWEGKYREASVVHDWYCSLRTADWQAVHLMFYRAMLVSNVSTVRAMVMYAAVRFFGPRWSEMDRRNILRAGASGPTKPIGGDILFYVLYDALTLGVAEAIIWKGRTALEWLESGPVTEWAAPFGSRTADRDAELVLQLDRLEEIIKLHDPKLRGLEKAIAAVLRFMPPNALRVPRTVNVGALTAED
jgi:hypothetical protein